MAFILKFLCTEPEVDGAESNQHAGQHRRFLSQHDRSVVVEPPVQQRDGFSFIQNRFFSKTRRSDRPGGSGVPQGRGHVFREAFLHERHPDPRSALQEAKGRSVWTLDLLSVLGRPRLCSGRADVLDVFDAGDAVVLHFAAGQPDVLPEAALAVRAEPAS